MYFFFKYLLTYGEYIFSKWESCPILHFWNKIGKVSLLKQNQLTYNTHNLGHRSLIFYYNWNSQIIPKWLKIQQCLTWDLSKGHFDHLMTQLHWKHLALLTALNSLSYSNLKYIPLIHMIINLLIKFILIGIIPWIVLPIW